MIRKIENTLYCVKDYMGNRAFVEADNEKELAEYVAEEEIKKGRIISSVTMICYDGSTPRISLKSNPYYKKRVKELLGKGEKNEK